MRDEMDSRIWVEHHQAFSDGSGELLRHRRRQFGAAFRRLNEIEFDAPWKRDVRGPGHA